MTATPSEPRNFVCRASDYRISPEAMALMAVIIEGHGKLLQRQCGQPLPGQVVDLQQELLDCVADSQNTSPINRGRCFLSDAGVSELAKSPLQLALSQLGFVDPAIAGDMLGGIQEGSVRDLCRRGQLEFVKLTSSYLIPISAVERRIAERGE